MCDLESRGHVVTSQWLKAFEGLSDEYARKDLDDVAAADMLLFVNYEAWKNSGTGGRHVEFGYAIALGRRIVLIGSRSNIFHYLSNVEVYETVEAFMVSIS